MEPPAAATAEGQAAGPATAEAPLAEPGAKPASLEQPAAATAEGQAEPIAAEAAVAAESAAEPAAAVSPDAQSRADADRGLLEAAGYQVGDNGRPVTVDDLPIGHVMSADELRDVAGVNQVDQERAAQIADDASRRAGTEVGIQVRPGSPPAAVLRDQIDATAKPEPLKAKGVNNIDLTELSQNHSAPLTAEDAGRVAIMDPSLPDDFADKPSDVQQEIQDRFDTQKKLFDQFANYPEPSAITPLDSLLGFQGDMADYEGRNVPYDPQLPSEETMATLSPEQQQELMDRFNEKQDEWSALVHDEPSNARNMYLASTPGGYTFKGPDLDFGKSDTNPYGRELHMEVEIQKRGSDLYFINDASKVSEEGYHPPFVTDLDPHGFVDLATNAPLPSGTRGQVAMTAASAFNKGGTGFAGHGASAAGYDLSAVHVEAHIEYTLQHQDPATAQEDFQRFVDRYNMNPPMDPATGLPKYLDPDALWAKYGNESDLGKHVITFDRNGNATVTYGQRISTPSSLPPTPPRGTQQLAPEGGPPSPGGLPESQVAPGEVAPESGGSATPPAEPPASSEPLPVHEEVSTLPGGGASVPEPTTPDTDIQELRRIGGVVERFHRQIVDMNTFQTRGVTHFDTHPDNVELESQIHVLPQYTFTDTSGVTTAYFTASIHGKPEWVQPGSTTQPIDARVYAQLIKDNGWKPGTPILLLSCETGQLPDGFAQQLSKHLGVEVIAPSQKVMVVSDGVDSSGNPLVKSVFTAANHIVDDQSVTRNGKLIKRIFRIPVKDPGNMWLRYFPTGSPVAMPVGPDGSEYLVNGNHPGATRWP